MRRSMAAARSSSAMHPPSSTHLPHDEDDGSDAELVALQGFDGVLDEVDFEGVFPAPNPSGASFKQVHAAGYASSLSSLLAQSHVAASALDVESRFGDQVKEEEEQQHTSLTASPSPSVGSNGASTSSGGHTDSELTLDVVVGEQQRQAGKHGGAGRGEEATEADLLEVRRKRNRESMRRVRLRKRDAKINTQQMVDHLEAKLQQLMDKNRHAAIQLATREGGALTTNVPIGESSFPELLSETASLSSENKHLRDDIKKYQVFEATMSRMIEEQAAEEKILTEEEALSEDAEILKPLLSWLTPSDLEGIMELAVLKIQENRALIESLVHRPNNALGWSDQRCIEGMMARYLLKKTFHHESVDSLAHKTWESIVDIDKLAKVMRWANGMKILYWLSADAAVVSRELNIPNPHGSEFPTRFRFTLLVFRLRIANGYFLGTINLNIYGTSVEECLQKDTAFKNGVNAHTMYGWTFTAARCKDTNKEMGCHVELAGLTGNGTQVYAHNVLMEMLTVVLLWENASVSSIRLLKT